MPALLLIRHGATSWNEAGRLQGRADPPLSPAGEAEVRRWRLPQGWQGTRWLSSPLRRGRDTAALLAGRPVAVDARLIEMDWGGYEGRRLADLRAQEPVALAENEARGLDFRPPGGESPREVCARLAALAADLAQEPAAVVAVTHKGVIRAALALATGWEMRAKPPLRLLPHHALALAVVAGRIAAGATIQDLRPPCPS